MFIKLMEVFFFILTNSTIFYHDNSPICDLNKNQFIYIHTGMYVYIHQVSFQYTVKCLLVEENYIGSTYQPVLHSTMYPRQLKKTRTFLIKRH